MTDADLARWEAHQQAMQPFESDTCAECQDLLDAAVPALLAEVRRLRAAKDHLEIAVAKLSRT